MIRVIKDLFLLISISFIFFNITPTQVFGESSSESTVTKNYKDINLAIEPIYFKSGFYNEGKRMSRDYSFSEGLAWVTIDSEGTAVVINQNGEQVIGPKYRMDKYAYQFSEGLSRVLNNNQWIYIDLKGNEVLTTNYDHVYNFQNGLAAVRKGNKWGFINKSGQEVIRLQYDALSKGSYLFDDGTDGFYEGRAAVQKGGQWGVIDTTGKVIIPFKYSSMDDYNDGITYTYINNRQAYFDRAGRQLTQLPPTSSGWPFSEGLVSFDNIFKDKTGKTVFKLNDHYSPSGVFIEGMVRIDGIAGYGFMNKQGKVVIKPQYEEAQDFSEGLAMVSTKDKILYIDKTGKAILSFNQNDVYRANSFKDGMAEVWVYSGGSHNEANIRIGYISNPLIIKVTVDGIKLTLAQPPININGSVHVPMRAIFSSLKANISFDQKTRTITASKGSTIIKLTVGQDVAYINGDAVKLATKVQSINDTTMVPLRFVSEALAANVQLDTSTNTISILSAK